MGIWNARKVLVTGAGGFIGSHLVERLVQEGAQVRAFVRYTSRGSIGLLQHLPHGERMEIEIISGDLRDLAAIHHAAVGIQTIFHLGALIAIPYSYHHPAEVVETNVIGTLNVLQAGRESGVERIVHTSTSEVYGTARNIPMGEDHPLQGQSPYSASKIGADMLAESFYRAFDLPVVTLRPFNTYGPRQSARAVIPTIITQALTQDTIRLGNLEAQRDLTYVSDTVEGFLKAGSVSGVEGQIFNLGVGSAIRIQELTELIVDLMSRSARIDIEPSRLRPQKSEVDRLLSDHRRASEKLGWSPQVSLQEGLSQTIAWIENNLDFYQDIGTYQI